MLKVIITLIKLFKIIRFTFHYFFMPNSRIVNEAIAEMESYEKRQARIHNKLNQIYPKRIFRPNPRQVRRLKLISHY